MLSTDFHKLKAAIDLEQSGAQPLSGETQAERVWEALLLQEQQRLLESNNGRTGPGCLEPWPGKDGLVAMRTSTGILMHTGVFTDIDGDEVRLSGGVVVDRRKFWPPEAYGTEASNPEHVVGHEPPAPEAEKDVAPEPKKKGK